MRAIEATVRELLAAAQAARKAKLDPGRVYTRFVVGDRVLLRTKELLDAADTSIGKLRPRWDGPFTVVACPGPNTYTLALPRKMCCSPTVNVERLKPFFERLDALSPPGPVLDSGQEGEHEVELLLNRSLVRGVTQYLVRWRGHAAVTLRRRTLGSGWRSWTTAASSWRSTTRSRRPVALPVAPLTKQHANRPALYPLQCRPLRRYPAWCSRWFWPDGSRRRRVRSSLVRPWWAARCCSLGLTRVGSRVGWPGLAGPRAFPL